MPSKSKRRTSTATPTSRAKIRKSRKEDGEFTVDRPAREAVRRKSRMSDKDKLSSKSKKNTTVGGFHREKAVKPEQKECFVNFLKKTLSTGVSGILAQYHTHLQTFWPQDCTRQAFDANPDKNRYKDVICVDNNRVILNNGQNSYIHANYVRGEPLVNQFICTQGPMASTVPDFWQMVVQEKVENIFMLCEVVEQGKKKCEHYFPRNKGEVLEFQGIRIENVKVNTSDTTTILTTLEVSSKNEKRTLNHYLWKTWPDRSVPQSVLAPFRLLKVARWSGVTIIHCSAGVGRTGTIAALELCVQELLTCRPLDVVQTIQRLRTMRMHSVQTDLQLLYIHRCLIAFARVAKLIEGELDEMSKKFDADYNEHLKKYAEQDHAYPTFEPAAGFGGNGLLSPKGKPSPGGATPQNPQG